ncbi:MAG TPA: ATP-grasp domain-containing protein [Roseiarcus sp.]|nr:ATP-grasp domain-containing protein [Roseiarcus sp.]
MNLEVEIGEPRFPVRDESFAALRCEPAVEAGRAAFAPLRRVLMVSALYKMPYRVMRCAVATGAEVFVLGGPAARRLVYSRFCRRFVEAGVPIDGLGGEDLLDAINRQVEALDVDCVLPGDAPSTRSLIVLRDRIRARVFPSPDLETFDLLNDKARFQRYCASAGVPTPRTWLFESTGSLRDAIAAGTLPAKTIAKPLSRSGGEGCVALEGQAEPRHLAEIDYAPIVVQEFVEGEDVCASVFCSKGNIIEFVAYQFGRDVYRTFAAPPIRREIERLLRPLDVEGMFGFDMRRDREGRIYFVECNPRVTFRIDLSMLAGVNFIALGTNGPPCDAISLADKRERTVRGPKALLVALATPWRIERESLRALRFTLADPVPYLREESIGAIQRLKALRDKVGRAPLEEILASRHEGHTY